VLQLGIAFPVSGRRDRDVLEHVPLHTVLAPFKSSDPPTAGKAPPNVAEEAQRCGDVEKDEPSSTRETLRQEFRVVPVNYPTVGHDRGVMQSLEVSERARHPISSRKVMEHVKMNGLRLALPGDSVCKRRLAAVRRTHNANPVSEFAEFHHPFEG